MREKGKSNANGKRSGDCLLCRKMNKEVCGDNPVCQAPDEPCKFRSECLIYAIWRDK